MKSIISSRPSARFPATTGQYRDTACGSGRITLVAVERVQAEPGWRKWGNEEVTAPSSLRRSTCSAPDSAARDARRGRAVRTRIARSGSAGSEGQPSASQRPSTPSRCARLKRSRSATRDRLTAGRPGAGVSEGRLDRGWAAAGTRVGRPRRPRARDRRTHQAIESTPTTDPLASTKISTIRPYSRVRRSRRPAPADTGRHP